MPLRAHHQTLGDFARSRVRPSLVRFSPRAWLSPSASLAIRGGFKNAYLLYVSHFDPSGNGAGTIDVFPGWQKSAHPTLLGQITGLVYPSALTIDSHGTLYVCQTDLGAPVLVFPLGAARPSLALQTDGNLAVSVAVSPAGTVFVGTANVTGAPGKILVYAPGRTAPARKYDNLAGDAVGALRTDERANVYFAGDFVGFGNYVGELTPAGSKRDLLSFGSPVLGLELDRYGNLVIQRDEIDIYARGTKHLLRRFASDGFQSLSFDATDASIFSASGDIEEHAYPSGVLVNTITSLAVDNTFGLATFPAAPRGLPW